MHKYGSSPLLHLYLPRTLTGFLWGKNPNVYWKIPRPWKRTGAKATFFWIFSWISRSQDPLGLCTWLNRSFSPKANTGTRDALERKYDRKNKLVSKWQKSFWVESTPSSQAFLWVSMVWKPELFGSAKSKCAMGRRIPYPFQFFPLPQLFFN